jgi:long-subunit fatty acid transport protein
MKKTWKIVAIALLAIANVCPVMAGGILTNTNQNVAFLRNPARDGAIGIDGVYSNPAGVAFMKDGLHLSFNWQAAFQTRTIDSANPFFQYGIKNNGSVVKSYEGTSRAMFIPSLQAAYNKNKWSFQFNFAVTGGGGKCEFDEGLGSFEGAVGQIAHGLQKLGVTNYGCTSYMQGKQYYFGFTLGTAYKITENLSVYGGLRVLYGIASYKAKINNIMVKSAGGDLQTFNAFLTDKMDNLKLTKYALEQAGATATPTYQQVVGTLQKLDQLETYRNGVNLISNQTGTGVAPILGADFKYGKFNFAVKYEFRTKMAMKNESTVDKVYAIDAVNTYLDDTKVREDQPSLLALGVQYSPVERVRINAGYHHFYDKNAKKTYYVNSVRYDNKNSQLKKGTDEYLGGVEVDIAKKWTASAGFQITRYGNTDEYINDISFVVNSWSFGLGAKYQVSDRLAVQAAFFQTNYDKYTTQAVMVNDTKGNPIGINQNAFSRTNRVVAIGANLDF